MTPNSEVESGPTMAQVVDELFSYWTLEDSEDTLEQLEDLLIVRTMPCLAGNTATDCA